MTTEQLSYLDDVTATDRLAYADRHDIAVKRGVVVNVYVPVQNAVHMIDPGSAIAGLPTPSGERILVYFEGGRFTAMTYAEKLVHAVGRMVTRYPTIAAGFYHADTLRQVGTYDVATRNLTVTDEAALDAWRATVE